MINNVFFSIILPIVITFFVNFAIDFIPFFIKKKTELFLELNKNKDELIFAKLHESRADVLRILYRKIIITETTLNALVSFMKEANSHKNLADKARISINDMLQYYFENKILLSENLCDHIDNLTKKSGDIYNDYIYSFLEYDEVISELKPAKLKEIKEARKGMVKAWESMKNEFPAIKKELETELRKLMGVGS